MKDKYGREINFINGVYSCGGISITAESEEKAIIQFNSMRPELPSLEILRGRDISEFEGILDYQNKNTNTPNIVLISSVQKAREFFSELIFKNYEKRMKEVFDMYPKYESVGWFRKSLQAERWLNMALTGDNAGMAEAILSASLPIRSVSIPRCLYRMIFREAIPNRLPQVTNEDIMAITELSIKIMINGELFEEYYGDISGYKTQLIREVNIAETVEQFLNLDVEFSQVNSLLSRVS